MVLEEILDKIVTNNPNKVAITFKNEDLTYLELQRKVNIFASKLAELGVNYRDRVGVLLNNSPQFIISFFAIAKIGAIVVPLDTKYKPEELRFIFEHCNMRTLVIANEFVDKAAKLSNLKKFIVSGLKSGDSILSFEELLKQRPNQDIKRIISAEDEALYLYTSGSTGKPKNIIRTHRNLVSEAENVDPLEIERLLLSFSKVKEVAVIGIKDEFLGESVKAIVVLKEKSTAREILDFCRGKLADYKIPRQIEFRDTLPKNSMGKILREELEEI